MLQLVRNSAIGIALVAAGWVLGSIFPAPGSFTALAKERARPILERIDLRPQGLAQLRASLSPQQLANLSRDAAVFASSTGDAIRVERLAADVLEEYVATQPEAPRAAAPGSTFETSLHLCPGMSISNAPPANESNEVQNYANVVNVNGVALATNPTIGACLSSGVGNRNGRMHKGVDYYSRTGGAVLAAASGTVIEKLYRDDYGNMLLIDHGSGVYTRYAHLSSFGQQIEVGERVEAGQQVGLMGNTASYPIPVHLHYEILLGSYANRAGSFGLAPRSPFDFAAVGQLAAVRERAAIIPVQLTRESARNVCPGGAITSTAVITIRHGDTLASIARACYRDEEAWRTIASCNHFLEERNRGQVSPLTAGHLLYVGDRIVLPAPGDRCA